MPPSNEQVKLAEIRTALANERTLLAYGRTSLALIIGGLSFVHFFESFPLLIIGWIFVPLGIALFALGFVRFRKMQSLVKSAEARADIKPAE